MADELDDFDTAGDDGDEAGEDAEDERVVGYEG